ncbi:hypothetical protein BDR06DRAFT_1008273 [Suillus hirtellus]|nr:hypothetical protein BDR06DRAFT_1008273 [Suillus hirtellus]
MSRSDLGYGFAVAAFVAVAYDWALTFGQEVELVWRQRWSLMTVMYLGVRYLGILVAALYMVGNVPTISLTDTILIFLVVTFLAINTFGAVTVLISMMHTSGEEFILSGTYQCTIGYSGDSLVLYHVIWILSIVWEVLTLCLAVWIAVEHFRESRLHATGEIIRDYFTVLIKTHVVYFASSVAVLCFSLIVDFSLASSTSQNYLEDQTLLGLLQILEVVQMSVLGPRLILDVREYNAKLVDDSDAATRMTSIAFQERVHISTSSSV